MYRIFFLLVTTFILMASNAQAAADAAQGKAKYQQLCVSCHGASGAGDGAAAAALNPKPRNLTDAAYMKTKTDAQLAKTIKEGGAAVGLSPMMPPWSAALNDQDIANVVAYLRTLAGGK